MERTVTDTVLRAVPRLGRLWPDVEHAISVPLLRRAGTLPAGALPAWWRISAAVRAEQERPARTGGPCPDLCLVVLAPSDVDTLGECARALGRARLTGSGGPAPSVELVTGLARLHGVLDLDPGADGDLLHVLAGIRTDDGAPRAAHRRLAARVGRMWTA